MNPSHLDLYNNEKMRKSIASEHERMMGVVANTLGMLTLDVDLKVC